MVRSKALVWLVDANDYREDRCCGRMQEEGRKRERVICYAEFALSKTGNTPRGKNDISQLVAFFDTAMSSGQSKCSSLDSGVIFQSSSAVWNDGESGAMQLQSPNRCILVLVLLSSDSLRSDSWTKIHTEVCRHVGCAPNIRRRTSIPFKVHASLFESARLIRII